MRDTKLINVGAIFVWGLSLQSWAQTPASSSMVYRCGDSTYTNQPLSGQHCKPLSTGYVTVIEGTRVSPAHVASSERAPAVEQVHQQQRDLQAQAVLQAELQKAQARHAELLRAWNGGEPERLPDERKQPSKYQARVQELQAALQRSEADMAGLQRELNRLSAVSRK